MQLAKVPLNGLIEDPISGEWGEEGNEVKVIRNTNFTNEGFLDITNIAFRKIEKNKIEKKRLRYGDIIIEKSGGSPAQPVGRVVYFNINNDTFLCSNFTSVIRNKKLIDSKYLFWFLFSNHLNKNTLRYQNKTTGIINLQLSRYINELQIPLPDLSTQQRIAAILDEADSLRKADIELIARYDELLWSSFLQLFGDPIINSKRWALQEVEKNIEKASVGVVIKPASYYVSEGIIALRSLNIRPNKILLDDLVYFPEAAHFNQLSKSILRKNDVVVVRTGSTGTAAIIPEELDGCNCIDLIIIRTNQSAMHPLYLVYLLNSDWGRQLISSKEVGGIQKHFNIGAIKKLKLPVPPISIQNQFVEIAVQIESQKLLVEQQLQQSEALFQSLLQRAFKREL